MQDMKRVGVGRIKVVLKIIPEMIFKIDPNSRIGLGEIGQFYPHCLDLVPLHFYFGFH